METKRDHINESGASIQNATFQVIDLYCTSISFASITFIHEIKLLSEFSSINLQFINISSEISTSFLTLRLPYRNRVH